MFTTERTANALMAKLDAIGWNPVVLTVKATGDQITVTPCPADPAKPVSPSNLGWLLMDCPGMNLPGEPTLNDAANLLNRFENIKASSMASKASLESYREKHIGNSTADERQLANTVAGHVCSAWSGGSAIPLEAFAASILPAIAVQLGITEKSAKNAWKLAMAMQEYSDRYKDLFGCRPNY